MAINKLSSYEVTYGITVGTGGTLTATNASITHNGTAVENTEVQVDAGGHLEASGTTFSIDNVAQDADSTLAQQRRHDHQRLQHDCHGSCHGRPAR